MFLSPILTCVVSFLSLYTWFLLLVCNILFQFHTKISWWVLFKVFQKYRLSKSTCYKLSSCKNFLEFVLRYILLYLTNEYELSDLWLFSYLIWLLWFCHWLLKGEIVRIYVIHLLGTYVTILCNWVILWQNTFYLYLGRSRMCLILQETLFQDQVLKPCKFIQDSSWKVSVIKARQLAIYRA